MCCCSCGRRGQVKTLHVTDFCVFSKFCFPLMHINNCMSDTHCWRHNVSPTSKAVFRGSEEMTHPSSLLHPIGALRIRERQIGVFEKQQTTYKVSYMFPAHPCVKRKCSDKSLSVFTSCCQLQPILIYTTFSSLLRLSMVTFQPEEAKPFTLLGHCTSQRNLAICANFQPLSLTNNNS